MSFISISRRPIYCHSKHIILHSPLLAETKTVKHNNNRTKKNRAYANAIPVLPPKSTLSIHPIPRAKKKKRITKNNTVENWFCVSEAIWSLQWRNTVHPTASRQTEIKFKCKHTNAKGNGATPGNIIIISYAKNLSLRTQNKRAEHPMVYSVLYAYTYMLPPEPPLYIWERMSKSAFFGTEAES